MDLSNCVAFILMQEESFLAEKRKLTKKDDPGAVALPGGHMKRGEDPEETLYREAQEELAIVPDEIKYVCSLLHRSPALHTIHYFAVEAWAGEIENHEAESLLWIPLGEAERLDIGVDRVAMSEYVRIYRDDFL